MQHPTPAIQTLLDLEPLKTWSLIVTLLGDHAAEDMSGEQIRAMLGPLGVRPEAIRVALHRLRADGWLVSERAGRAAVHRLSDHGRAETEAVRADVYEGHDKYPGGWCFVLTRDAVVPDGGMQIGRDLGLMPRVGLASNPGALVLRPDHRAIPDWVEECLVPAGLRRIAEVLAETLSATARAPAPMPDEDLASLRILTLHHWRRLALRRGTWAHMSLLPEGSVAACRSAVVAFLAGRA